MRSEHYAKGDAFQIEKRTIFSSAWLPLCAEAQLDGPGAFLSTTVGGWSVVAARDKAGEVHVLRNACRHQNMPVVSGGAGRCESFRCRFHGWTYDLEGRFLSAPPAVAPATPTEDHNLERLPTTAAGGLVFFSAGKVASGLLPGRPPSLYAGTITTDINCNWKVCVEHLLGEQPEQSPDFHWHEPLLLERSAGSVVIMEQIMPLTFLRTRLHTHVFGDVTDDHKQSATTIKEACEHLQTDRLAGRMAAPRNRRLQEFHFLLEKAYAEN
jgi:nitrite reductase/ring-hydroxylating ferredoxin subunit